MKNAFAHFRRTAAEPRMQPACQNTPPARMLAHGRPAAGGVALRSADEPVAARRAIPDRVKQAPSEMLPEIARRAIEFYSRPGDLVLDPMCGIATTLGEAIHQARRAIGIEVEPRWAALATANVQHARSQGATGQALVLTDNARRLGRSVLDQLAGTVQLVLTSPPYADTTLGDPRSGKARRCGSYSTSATRSPKANEPNSSATRTPSSSQKPA